MTTDANTQQLTDGVAQPDAVAQELPEVVQVAPEASEAPEAPVAAPAYTAPAQTQAPAQAQYAVPPQAPQAPQGHYGVPPQAPQFAVPASMNPAPGKNAYGFSVASFVIGIASILSAWTFVAPIVGLVLGILALRRNTTERTLALWGVWLNGAMLAFAAIGLVLFIGLASFGAFASAASYGF
ncbi:MAG: DUF4190 domain-containing protein [Leucobacter sp.]